MSGVLITISGASGVGKSVVVKDIFTRYPDNFGEAISTTTRVPRNGEVDGTAYHFVSGPEFTRRWNAGKFLEKVEYSGKMYGIEKAAIKVVMDQGKNVLLVVEPHGAQQIRDRWEGGPLLQLFLRPPSTEVLQERMEKRGDSLESISARLNADFRLFREHEFPYDAIFTNRQIKATADAIVQYVFSSCEVPLY
jgi:guanylate kinase